MPFEPPIPSCTAGWSAETENPEPRKYDEIVFNKVKLIIYVPSVNQV